jgi:hypothetical protein
MQAPEEISISLRIPEWSKETVVYCKGKEYRPKGGYLTLCEVFQSGDVIQVCLDTKIHVIRRGDKQLLKKCAYVLARDERYADGIDEAPSFVVEADGSVQAERVHSGKVHAVAEFSFLLKDGKRITTCDYSSAGKAWDSEKDLRVSVWL